MSAIKFFRLSAGQATELQGRAPDQEKPVQTLTERSRSWPEGQQRPGVPRGGAARRGAHACGG